MRTALTLLACMALTGCMTGGPGTYVAYRPHVSPKIPLVMPATAPPIAQQFMPLTPDGQPGHRGIDVKAPTGTPVLAAAPGRVTLSYYEPVYGNRIVVEHAADAAGRRRQTAYYHLDSRIVAVGAQVARGQQIGTLGETGLLSSYPHLHFELHREDAPGARVRSGYNWWQGMEHIDPNEAWLDGRGRITCFTGQSGDPTRITYPVPCS